MESWSDEKRDMIRNFIKAADEHNLICKKIKCGYLKKLDMIEALKEI